MIEWGEYLKSVVRSNTVLDKFTLTSDGEELHISPIVKASILMLEEMTAKQGNHNAFVFPETGRVLKEYLVSKTVYDITAGKIQMRYDPETFRKGQILKYKKCAVEFDQIETNDEGQTRIFIKFSDGMRYGVPIEYAPFFQISESKKLSTYKRFKQFFSAEYAKDAMENPASSVYFLDVLENYKTHLDGTVFYVSQLKQAREFITSAQIDEKKLTEVLYTAQINGDGILSNLSAGQLSGRPAVIIASDLYSVQNAVSRGIIPQTIIVNASQSNAVEKQLDALDSLGKTDAAIVCITDTADSFELSSLEDRNYNIWRWDKDSITESVFSSEISKSNDRIINCAKHSVQYEKLEEELISKSVQLLYRQKNAVEEQSPRITGVYEKLFSLTFLMLRNAVPLSDSDRERYTSVVNSCINDIETEKRFISAELYSTLLDVANTLLSVFSSQYKNLKYEKISSLILSGTYKSICIVIPEKLGKSRFQENWEVFETICDISVMYPLEFKEYSGKHFDLVIVVGWFGDKVMRHILYNFASYNYLVLTYPCEERWKKAHVKRWGRALNNSGNGDVISKSFNSGKRQISTAIFENTEAEDSVIPNEDELDDIELVIRTTKYRHYGGSGKSADIVDAVPVSFVGGYLAFYRNGHKALVATDIIANNGDRIESKLPEKLEIGDFIVIRESPHDMIRDIADLILERSGKGELRNLSSKWKEALSVEALFTPVEDIYDKLRSNGCKKDYVTVKNWMTSEDLIQPGDKEDLICIAKATGDQVLKEKLDEIYEAGREVRTAHVQAGRILSNRLKQKIVEHIQELGEIDAYNIWDPVSLQIDEIGLVKILKVIDIGSAIPVDIGNTNRLLSE